MEEIGTRLNSVIFWLMIPPLHHSMSQTYECMSLVELEAQLHQAPFNDQQQQIQQEQYYLFSSPPNPFVKTTKATISPFVVYDPRLIPKMILPDTKNWRSAPATEPCEYGKNKKKTNFVMEFVLIHPCNSSRFRNL